MTYHFLVKGRFHSWIALTFIISVHILHLSPHSSRTQYLVEQSYFLLLGGNCFEQLIGEYLLVLTNNAQMWFGGGPFFLASPWVCWSYPNWTTTTMCSFVIWSIETKFNLATPTIGVFAKFKFNGVPSWHIKSTPARASHLPCEFQRRCPPKWGAPHPFHIMWNLYKFQCLTL